MACAAWSTAPAHAAISITETDADSLRYATAPGWTIMSGATPSPPAPAGTVAVPSYLTAGGIDPADDGWLRLTEAVSYQHGTAVYNTAFSSAEGLQITFDYAAYGGNEADGISFFLIDGNTTNPTMGAHFGYLPRAPNVEPGVTNGYMGVVLNEYAGCDSQPPTVPPCQYDHVAVVGAGSLYGGFTGLHAVPLAGTAVGKIAPVDRARIVRVTISPVTPATLYPKVTVEIDPNDGVTGFVKLIDAFSLAGNGAVPKTFKMGFGASTGARKHIHEVRIRSAKTLVSAVPALEQSTLGALAVLLALLTLPALRRCLNG